MAKIGRGLMRAAAAVALVLIGWLLREAVGFSAKPRADKGRESLAVTAITVTNGVFNPPSEYVGHVEPAQVTDILPQVDGYIQRVCFTEGEKVKKGDLLFEIDEEQYLAAKNLRHSEVASAKAKVISSTSPYSIRNLTDIKGSRPASFDAVPARELTTRDRCRIRNHLSGTSRRLFFVSFMQ